MSDAVSDFTGPYRGLEPFDESAMAFFFGRERDTRLITASLFAAPLTLLYGASGVGKSSVLRAGVLPQLRARTNVLPVVYPRFSSTPRQRLVVERGWQTDPVSGIKETAAMALFASASDPVEQQRYRDVVWKHDMSPLQESLGAIADASGRLVMVILDQFEEYSLYHPGDDDLFATQFPRAVATRDRNVAFLVSLREDALAKLDRFKATIPTLWDTYRRIDHLDRAAGEDAIRKPLAEYNRRLAPGGTPVSIEDDLVAQVLEQVPAGGFGIGETGGGSVETPTAGPKRIETPYLQLVMTRLWEREQEENSPVLRASTLRDEGNAEQIVLTHLDRVMEQFSEPERDLAAKVFHRLVTPGGAKIAFSATDLATYEGVGLEVVGPILQRLEQGDRRILRRVAEPGKPNAEQRYEIFHDRLGRAMLAWRTKYLAEQTRQAAARQQAEQRRIDEESRLDRQRRVNVAMEGLRTGLQQTWATMMFYLVDARGVRQVQSLSVLVAESRASPDDTRALLDHLAVTGIVREAFVSKKSREAMFEIVDDPTAAALLEWHSRYAAQRSASHSLEIADAISAHAVPSVSLPETFPYETVRKLLDLGEVVPFLGSGATLSGASPKNAGANAPFTNRAVKEALARQCNYPATEFEASDVAEIASYFEQQVGRAELDALLWQLIGASQIEPSATHGFLADAAELHPLLILTTNYDQLMEKALHSRLVPFDVLAYVAAQGQGARGKLAVIRYGESEPRLQSASKLDVPRDRTIVFRLSGTADGSSNSYAITEEDHLDWIMSLRSRESWLPDQIATLLSRRHLLSLGHGARDWSQRALWHTLASRRGGRRTSWAVALHPAPMSVMTWQRYGVQIYNEDLNHWTERMRRLLPVAS